MASTLNSKEEKLLQQLQELSVLLEKAYKNSLEKERALKIQERALDEMRTEIARLKQENLTYKDMLETLRQRLSSVLKNL